MARHGSGQPGTAQHGAAQHSVAVASLARHGNDTARHGSGQQPSDASMHDACQVISRLQFLKKWYPIYIVHGMPNLVTLVTLVTLVDVGGFGDVCDVDLCTRYLPVQLWVAWISRIICGRCVAMNTVNLQQSLS